MAKSIGTYLVDVIVSRIDKTYRLIKLKCFGDADIKEVEQALPAGIDSAPLKGMQAILTDTSANDMKSVIGYLLKGAQAAPGEIRTFSFTIEEGNVTVQAYTWCKANGDLHLNGSANHAVQYEAMNTQLQQFKTDIQAELALIATGISGAGGAYTPGTLSLNLNSAKINTIKVP